MFELDHLEVFATSKSGLRIRVAGGRVEEILDFLGTLTEKDDCEDELLSSINSIDDLEVGTIVESVVGRAGGFMSWREAGSRGVVTSIIEEGEGGVEVRKLDPGYGEIASSLTFHDSEMVSDFKIVKS